MSNAPSDSTMSAPGPETTMSEATVKREQGMNFVTTTALIAAPILLLMPPRKLDLYTFSLCGLWVFSADHQVRNRSGLGLMEWVAARQRREGAGSASEQTAVGVVPSGMPTGGVLPMRPVDEAWREDLLVRARRRDPWARHDAAGGLGFDGRVRARHLEVLEGLRPGESPNDIEGLRRLAARAAVGSNAASEADDAARRHGDDGVEGGGVKGMFQEVWYGGEDPQTWKEKRMVEEREAVAEGKSVSDLILSQIWAVWTQAHKEEDRAKEHERRRLEEEKARQLAEAKNAESKV